MASLKTALTSFESRDLAGALEASLAVWRKTKDERLEALIIKLGATATARVSDWEATAKRRQPELLSPLLASIQGTSKVMKERALLLTAWPGDPRLDRWVVEQYAKPPFTSTGSGPFWTALKKLTTQITAPSALGALSKLRSSRLEGVKLRAPAEPLALSPEDTTALVALEAALEKRTAPSSAQRASKDVLGDVLANPGDVALRNILMDALLELGDPRGELLAIQLKPGARSAADKKKEKALITEHWDALLGPLAPALKPDSRFERGFLVHAELRAATSSAVENALKAASGHALWRTVESFCGEGSILRVGDFPVLREVETWRITVRELERFPKLESMKIRLQGDDLAALAAPGAFPALNSLSLTLEPALLGPFEAWAQTRAWRRLAFTIPAPSLPLYCELLRRPLALATGVFELVMTQADFARTQARVAQSGGKTQVAIKFEVPRVTHPEWHERLSADGLAVIEALAGRPQLEVEVVAGNATLSEALRARVASLGGRLKTKDA